MAKFTLNRELSPNNLWPLLRLLTEMTDEEYEALEEPGLPRWMPQLQSPINTVLANLDRQEPFLPSWLPPVDVMMEYQPMKQWIEESGATDPLEQRLVVLNNFMSSDLPPFDELIALPPAEQRKWTVYALLLMKHAIEESGAW